MNRKKVTRKSQWMQNIANGMLPEEWSQLRKKVFVRDHYRCQRCHEYFPHGHGMSPHHIMPRSEGGSDDSSNLISLCHPCHDYVEVHNLRSKAAIEGSYEEPVKQVFPVIPLAEVEAAAAEKREAFTRPDWHAWVYGGAPHPTFSEK